MRRVLTASRSAVLLEADDTAAALGVAAALEAAPIPGVHEVVHGVRTLLVHFDPAVIDARELRQLLLSLTPVALHDAAHESVTIPVVYDGIDLAETAQLLGVSSEALVRRHASAHWQVAAMGFAPGFGYLVTDDPLFDVPRLEVPRTRIPTGSVALAGRFSGVYPAASPGGWRLIGRTGDQLWNPAAVPAAKLTAGTTVRFEAAREVATLPEEVPPTKPSLESPYAIEVLQPGLQLLVQDQGRAGSTHQGVTVSGAVDREALALANLVVGNEPDAAALEVTMGGASLRFHGPAVIAIAGALAPADLEGHQLLPAEPYAVDNRDILQIGMAPRGARVIIGVRGGIDIEPELGSRSSDTLSGLGPAPLRAGDTVPLHGPHAAIRSVQLDQLESRHLPAADEVCRLRITLGPRDDWFTSEAIDTLTGQQWLVSADSNRVGIRLQGAHPLERAVTGELDSEPVVIGAIQVPSSGQPVVFLADHPVTGGYPVIGSVIEQDLPLAAQLPPGALLRFVIDEEANEI